MQRARTLSQEGERLIEHKHYAVDSIRPKCHELRDLCDQFAADVERRRGLLGKSLELHGLLEAVGPTPNPDPAPGPAGARPQVLGGQWPPASRGLLLRPRWSRANTGDSRTHLPQKNQRRPSSQFTALCPRCGCIPSWARPLVSGPRPREPSRPGRTCVLCPVDGLRAQRSVGRLRHQSSLQGAFSPRSP